MENQGQETWAKVLSHKVLPVCQWQDGSYSARAFCRMANEAARELNKTELGDPRYEMTDTDSPDHLAHGIGVLRMFIGKNMVVENEQDAVPTIVGLHVAERTARLGTGEDSTMIDTGILLKGGSSFSLLTRENPLTDSSDNEN